MTTTKSDLIFATAAAAGHRYTLAEVRVSIDAALEYYFRCISDDKPMYIKGTKLRVVA